jgi:hypothetical protein
LPQKDVARTSVLSKAWLDTWYTFPILYFSDTMHDIVSKGDNFIDYVKRRLMRFYDNGLAIKVFKLVVYNVELRRYMSKDVD